MKRTLAATLFALVLLPGASDAAHCQASVRAFTWGVVDVRKQSGVQLAAFVGSDGEGRERIYPLLAPENLSGEANWPDVTKPIDRVEIATASSFQTDVWAGLELLGEKASVHESAFDAIPLLFDVGRYKFQVRATLKGGRRDTFSLGTQQPARTKFWAFRPLTAAEERTRYSQGTTLVPRYIPCAVYFGFRLNRPAVFYWRGDMLAAVAEVSPEALATFKIASTTRGE